jgi:carbon storage regulator
MLVLTRKPGEQVRIGENITLVVVEVHGKRVRLGIEAPAQVSILRQELCPAAVDGAAQAPLVRRLHHAT